MTKIVRKNLKLAFVINTILTIIELFTGYISGSIALLADGMQNLTDSVVLSIAFIADKLNRKGRKSKVDQATIYRIAGSINALILIVLSIYVSYSAVLRFFHPQMIRTGLVISIGLLSLCVNWLAAACLYNNRTKKHIKAPYLGLIFSGFSGFGVFISGLIGYLFHVEHVDSIVGLIIAGILLIRSLNLLIQSNRT